MVVELWVKRIWMVEELNIGGSKMDISMNRFNLAESIKICHVS